MNQGESPEIQILLDVQESQQEIGSTLMAQLVEVQATLQVMVELKKLALTGDPA